MESQDDGQLRLFSIGGVSIGIHKSFFLVVLFLLNWQGPWDFKFKLLGLLFGSILVHEIAHALTGWLVGNRPRSIMLTFWGGFTEFERPMASKGVDAVIAFAGPFANLVLMAGAVFGVMTVCQNGSFFAWLNYFVYDFCDLEMLKVSLPCGVNTWQFGDFLVGIPCDAVSQIRVLDALVTINGMLAVFNLVPAYPLDGGRIFRVLSGYVVGSRAAAFLTLLVGRGFALAYAGWCVYHDFYREQQIVDGLIGCFIAWAVWQGCHGEYVRTRLFIDAELGDPEAEYAVGVMYINGVGVEVNYKKGFEWVLKSAEHGHAPGQCMAAECYLFGVGVERDFEKAASLFEKAFNADDWTSAIELRLMYEFKLLASEDGKVPQQYLDVIAAGGEEASQEYQSRRAVYEEAFPVEKSKEAN